MAEFSGYHDCPCRDCFEIAIGGLFNHDRSECDDSRPGLCHECQDADCDPDGESECQSPHAYGQDDLCEHGNWVCSECGHGKD